MTRDEEKLKRLLDGLIPLIGLERAMAFVIRTDREVVNKILAPGGAAEIKPDGERR